MLSPGQSHRRIPKDRRRNLLFRKSLLAVCQTSNHLREEAKAACREDFLFFVNVFVWQYNPRKKGGGEIGPFITWDFQDAAALEILRCVATDEDVLLEKSREMGASWLCLLIILWMWLFHPWQKFLVISRNEDAVDDRADPDSLFWKLDFVLENLPGWMMPVGWDAKRHRLNLSFTNPETKSVITGQASTGKAGVGGRASAMFIDEFSQIKEDYEVLHRTSDTTGCRIFNGTHKGQGTAFAELAARVDIKKVVMHWVDHPDKWPGAYRYDATKNQVQVLDTTYPYPPDFEFVRSEAPAGGPNPGIRSPWYDRECLRKGSPRAVAMDLDIDPGGSVAQVFNPLTIRVLTATYCRAPFWEGHVSYDRDSGKPLGLIEMPGGPFKVWEQMKDGGPPRGVYGAGGDISTGRGVTPSCLSWCSAVTGEKVAEYETATVGEADLAPIACALCRLFIDDNGTPCLFAWEANGPGLTFGKKFVELGYPNVFYREAHATLAGGKISSIPGWYSQNDTKRILIEDYRAALDNRQYVNRSARALADSLAYRYDDSGNVVHPHEIRHSDPTGARVNHGDFVIADALAWKMARSYGKIGNVASKERQEIQVGTLAWRRLIHETGVR